MLPVPSCLLAAALLLGACTAAGGASPDRAAPPAGHRTTVEVALPGGALVVEVLASPDRARGRSWTATGDARRLLLEEVRIGDDHWVQLPALVDEGILEPGWIHVDLADGEQRRWHEAHGLGLLEHADLWTAGPGHRHGDQEIVAVERRSPTRRELRTDRGLELRVHRVALRRPPSVEPPDPESVVPLHDVDRLLRR